jgi:hypothetical protein
MAPRYINRSIFSTTIIPTNIVPPESKENNEGFFDVVSHWRRRMYKMLNSLKKSRKSQESADERKRENSANKEHNSVLAAEESNKLFGVQMRARAPVNVTNPYFYFIFSISVP